jgi:hypothetical protein
MHDIEGHEKTRYTNSYRGKQAQVDGREKEGFFTHHRYTTGGNMAGLTHL